MTAKFDLESITTRTDAPSDVRASAHLSASMEIASEPIFMRVEAVPRHKRGEFRDVKVRKGTRDVDENKGSASENELKTNW